MLDVTQKRNIRRVMYHKATLGSLFVLMLLFAHSTWVVYKKKVASEGLKNTSLQTVAALQARKTELDAHINRLHTEAGVEEEIRSKFAVAKGGESMVVVVDEAAATTSTTTPEESFLGKIWNFFF